jgi:hypothetical protein
LYETYSAQTVPRGVRQAIQELARRLSVAERQLDYWMRDIGPPPFFDVTTS